MTDNYDAELVDDIKLRAADLTDRLDAFMQESDPELTESIGERARHYVYILRHSALEDAKNEVARSIRALVDDDDHEFWSTPLGRLVAERIGYGRDAVPRNIAAVILEVTRQRVYQMVREDKLAEASGLADNEYMIDNASLLARLRRP